jgi:hypothetical protein
MIKGEIKRTPKQGYLLLPDSVCHMLIKQGEL